ncbi:CTAG/PCC1 family protein [Thermosphaera chiliense]|uniref:CTAG/PCC1 family protein n=1 Tax=Thermosphaera chiliense TaxID=3402707 RepID=A0A7M1UQQ3_9CREN|nr:CTAG/PCC1 family protein [Thermosphaera aggregans]QOR94521.1 CTAG/PCC1 family protein [Thermosphaera aggregans]
MNEYSVEYSLNGLPQQLCMSLEKALKPEAESAPKSVEIIVECSEGVLTLKMRSTEINILRALHNSFIGLIIMLLELSEGLRNEQEDASARGSAVNSSIPDFKGDSR